MTDREKAEEEYLNASAEYLRLLEQNPEDAPRGIRIRFGAADTPPFRTPFRTPWDYERALEKAKRKLDFWREFLRDETESSGADDQPTRPGEKPQSNKDVIRAFAKGGIACNSRITRTELAEIIKAELPEGSGYEIEYLINITRDLFPDYTDLKPGRKKSR